MTWMARCKVMEVGVASSEAELRAEGPYVILRPASLDDLRMLGGALYTDVFIEPGVALAPTEDRSSHDRGKP